MSEFMNFADRVEQLTHEKKSCVVVGLDPRLDWLPAEFGLGKGVTGTRPDGACHTFSQARAADAVLEFNRRIIRAVSSVAVAVKPQIAFYEALGWRGLKVYAETIAIAREAGLLTIGDVKRGDIGSTAEAYASAHLDRIPADAVTINPYLGSDSVKPFTDYCGRGKGVFVLVKTSNASSSELQDWPSSAEAAVGRTVWARVAELVEGWGSSFRGSCGYSAVGAVVGATFPDIAALLRRAMPHTLFLLPGYGAQGADAESCRVCFDAHGNGALVNSSRGIIFAHRSEPWRSRFGEARWEEAVRAAAVEMRDSLEKVRMKAG